MNNRLLVIEDNEQNLYLMRFLLEKSGFAVIGAEDGKKGIEMALQCAPLGILLDIQLPEMDGYAVAAELKKHHALAQVPIIAVFSPDAPNNPIVFRDGYTQQMILDALDKSRPRS